jgi:hypothetical protein
MRRLLALIPLALMLCGCVGDGVQTTRTNNTGYNVTLLFEHEGVKVYRFLDGSYYRYYTDARGSAHWDEACGKGCSNLQEIPTIK